MSKRLYFAYGSNMDRRQMAQRCPAASLISTGWSSNYGYKIDGRGFATIVEQEKSRVWGVVWRLTEACEMALDRYEGVSKGIYGKEMITVEAQSTPQSCLVYISAYRQALKTRPNLPNLGYQERIVAAAKEFDFPADYREELSAWLPDPEKFPVENWAVELQKQRATVGYYRSIAR